MDLDRLKTQLRIAEGVRYFPYKDTTGHLTIGVGHNLTQNGLPATIVESLLTIDISAAIARAIKLTPWGQLSDARQRAFVELAFNLDLAEFHDLLAETAKGDWDAAANALLNSLADHQEPARIARLAAMVRTGNDPVEVA